MSDNKRLHEILDTVSRIYHHELTRGGSSRIAQQYLHNRWVFPPTIDTWRLGYAPRARNGTPWILDRMNDHASPGELIEAGVLVSTERGLMDPMEGRVIFPQAYASGHICGFVGRVIGSDDAKDKYLATPSTAIFRRAEMLYRIDISYRTIQARDEAVVVEGLLDAILMWQVGARHIVATGTAGMSDAQAQVLSRYTKRLGVMFDADAQDAADRVRTERKMWFKSIEKKDLPVGIKDPAAWVEQKILTRINT